jgi:hypothetical protein
MNHGMVNRRRILTGMGATVALPWLEGLASAAAPASPPKRLAFMYVPNGVHMPDWRPAAPGVLTALPPTLQPLEKLRDDLVVLTGLTADKARPHGDGGGDHARALAAFLTGSQARKTDGTDIRAGLSADQVAASRLGHLTRLASLEIGTEAGAMAGNCDSGYSCVYSSTMSWKSATQPLPKEVDPKLVFDRLFGQSNDPRRKERDRVRKSVLDHVLTESKSLAGGLGASDRRKLDEYFSSVREIEERIARAEKLPPAPKPEFGRPSGVPASLPEHLRLLCDLLVLAFQTDSTRVATFVLANEGSNRPYPFAQVSEGHHDLSHHGNDKSKQEKISKINLFHTTQLAYLAGKMKSIREGDGTLLDHCLLAYGSGNSDGNAHNHDDLPIALLGGKSAGIKGGRHLVFSKETPLANLWLAMLDRAGVGANRLGDSTGVLDGLIG